MPGLMDELQRRLEEAQERVDLHQRTLDANPDSWEARKNLEYANRLLAIWEERVRDGK